MRRFLRSASVALLACISMSVLSGCAALTAASGWAGPTTTSTCVLWVAYDDESQLRDAATVVARGVVGPAEPQTVELGSGPGIIHSFSVLELVKGDVPAGDLRVTAPRDFCGADDSPADPLREGDAVVLYLSDAEVGGQIWTLPNPSQGIIPAE